MLTPDITAPATAAATGETQETQAAGAAPARIKLSPHGFRIDHPDPERGEQLMMNALGVADRDAMEGILRQLVKASVSGGRANAVTRSLETPSTKS
ncbi:hypothetical protein H8A99_11280 [Bradyrhizobium sp. Arg68]|uniref:hypothetical protein n=1 Tax=Bradyrhizobium ivorense TaxID=2511166 RepID=UPI001E5C1809|nr:hypothetical protein [Bradyrhizobium ivorense]MCC8937049.1 hypothetical protein [Bradyrhizobium ivorense]